MVNDIKVGDEFFWTGPESKWVTRGKRYRVIAAGDTVRIETDHGPFLSGQLTFQKTPTCWAKAPAVIPVTVKPGQVWAWCDGETFTPIEPCADFGGEKWWGKIQGKAQSRRVWIRNSAFTDGTLRLVSDAPETVATSAAFDPAAKQSSDKPPEFVTSYPKSSAPPQTPSGKLDVLAMMKQKGQLRPYQYASPRFTVDWNTDTIHRINDEPQIYRRDPGFAQPIRDANHDASIAAKMQAHNDAYADRHKAEIQKAWAATSQTYSLPDTGACRWQRRRS